MKNEINIMQTSESWMYLVKSKALGYELAEDWMLFWTFFMPIALIINFSLKDYTLIYKGLLYIIPVFAMTIIRRNIVSSIKYILANALIISLTFIISFTLIEKVIFLIPIIMCCIISLRKRYKEVVQFYKISMLFWSETLMVICYFFAFNYNLTFSMNLINFASINVAITCALYVFISRSARLMEWESEFIKGYSKRMRRIKLSSIAFISGVIVFFILLAKWAGLYKLFDVLTSKILAYLNLQPYVNYNPISTNSQTNNSSIKTQASMIKVKPIIKNSYLATFIINILQFIIYAAVAFFIIYLLIKLFIIVKNFYKGLTLKKSNKKEEKEFVISINDMVDEIKEKSVKVRDKLELPFNVSNRKKIRKLYHKLIKSYKIKGVSAYDFNTPIEIESKVREVLEKNINEATVIYEKARYSNAECSKEDVNKMKSLLQ